MNTSYFQIESFVPSWLQSDPGYLKALQQALTNRMLVQGWEVVEGPFVENHTDEGLAVVPVGMVLLQVWCGVQEFDVEVPMPEEVRADEPPAVWLPQAVTKNRIQAASNPESYARLG